MVSITGDNTEDVIVLIMSDNVKSNAIKVLLCSKTAGTAVKVWIRRKYIPSGAACGTTGFIALVRANIFTVLVNINNRQNVNFTKILNMKICRY